jgi:hypothetical protein
MNTTYLRFPSQEVWEQVATAVGVLSVVNLGTEEEPDMQQQWSYYTHDWAVDDVGVIYNDDGVYDEDTGDVITPPTPMDGWHVNYKAATLPSDLEAYVVTPNSPHRKFAGE